MLAALPPPTSTPARRALNKATSKEEYYEIFIRRRAYKFALWKHSLNL